MGSQGIGALITEEVCLLACLPAIPAQAAFPGQNGKIAYAENPFNVGGLHGIWTVNPDGTALTRITTLPDTDPV